jgi:phospholipid/cholesterol/gamma-HCH transport system permease protein
MTETSVTAAPAASSRSEGAPTAGTLALSLREAGEGRWLLVLAGPWTKAERLPALADVEGRLSAAGPVRRVGFDTDRVTDWDSALVVFIGQVEALAARVGADFDVSGLPEGAQRVFRLARAVPPRAAAGPAGKTLGVVGRIGAAAIDLAGSVREAFTFVGEVVVALVRFVTGRARFRRADFITNFADCGPGALPIVSLISFLTGMILAFVGAIQLTAFGAQIFVANLVGIAMAVEMGALMTGIIMAGRAGASFAAQIGTMQVNEEIDALRTTGLSPVEFLVLPRILALFVMTPLLALYANFLGILGGAFIGVTLLDLSWDGYIAQTRGALNLVFFAKGLIKAAVFGVLVAMAGCLRGMQCGRSAEAVGIVTTSAVVTSLVLIVVADAVITVIYNALGW